MPEYKKPAELLDEILDKLFERVEEGIRHEITDEKKNTIKDEMKETLGDKLGFDELKEKDVQNKLLGSITAKLLGDKKQSDSLLDSLLNPKKLSPEEEKKTDKDLEEKLKQDFLMLAALSEMLKPDKDGKKMSPLDAAKKLLMNKDTKKKDESKSEDKKPDEKEEKELEKLLDASLRNLYGGANPTVSGGINFTILGPIVGNLCAYVDQATPNADSVAFMVEAVTYNPNKTDYLGLENALKLADLAEGIPLSSTRTNKNTPY